MLKLYGNSREIPIEKKQGYFIFLKSTLTIINTFSWFTCSIL